MYDGPCLEDAPDVVVKWGLCRGYSYDFKVSAKSRGGAWIARAESRAADGMQFFKSKSGTHRDDGIFVACGPRVKSGETIEGARIVDLAPTILHLLEVPVPGNMDGRVLLEALVDGEAAPVLTSAHATTVPEPAAQGSYSAEDEETIVRRLRALGYLD